MKFNEALQAMYEGKKIKRKEWVKSEDHDCWYFDKYDSLTSNMDEAGDNPLVLKEDLFADDWEIV